MDHGILGGPNLGLGGERMMLGGSVPLRDELGEPEGEGTGANL